MTDDLDNLRVSLDGVKEEVMQLTKALSETTIHVDYLRAALIERKSRAWAGILGLALPMVIALTGGAWWASHVTEQLGQLVEIKADVRAALAQTDDRFRGKDFVAWHRKEFMPLVQDVQKIKEEHFDFDTKLKE